MSQNPKDITEKAYLAYCNEFGYPPKTATHLSKWAKSCTTPFIGVTFKTAGEVIKNPPNISKEPEKEDKSKNTLDIKVDDIKQNESNNTNPPNIPKEPEKVDHIKQNESNNTNVNNIQNLNQNDDKKCILQNNNIQKTDCDQKQHQAVQKPDKQPKRRGLLLFQNKSVTKEQIEYIKANITTNPKFLFDDNDIDNARSCDATRKHNHGVLGSYDRSFGYGIVITFHNTTRPGLSKFKQLMDDQFKELQQHLANGNDVIILKPKVNAKDKHKYFKNGKQIIHHNIGSYVKNFPMPYAEYIQLKMNDLQNYAEKKVTFDYYKYTPTKTYGAPKTVGGRGGHNQRGNRGRGGYDNRRRGGHNYNDGGRGRNKYRGGYNNRYRNNRGGGGYNGYNNNRGGYHNHHRGGGGGYRGGSGGYRGGGGYNRYHNNNNNSQSKKVMELESKIKEYELQKQHNQEMEKIKKEKAALQRQMQKLQELKGIINVWEMQKNNGVFLRFDKTISDTVEKLAIGKSHFYSRTGQKYKITKTSKISGCQINTAYPDMKRVVRRIQIDASVLSIEDDAKQQISSNDGKQKILDIRKNTPCKFGNKCTWFKQGTCEFLHEQNPEKIKQNIRKKMPCQFGDDCKWFKQGKCEFLHVKQSDNNKNECNQENKQSDNNDNVEYENEGNQENNYNEEEGPAPTAYH